jgi:hypothetical protein
MYEINSIGTSSGDKASGDPGGKNRLKKWRPCFLKPIMFKPTKVDIPRLNVNIMWLVTVKVYGIIPKILQNSIKQNVVKIKGKNREPFSPNASKSIP